MTKNRLLPESGWPVLSSRYKLEQKNEDEAEKRARGTAGSLMTEATSHL